MIGIESGKHFACAAFVRTTVVTIIPSPLQRLHGFGYNGIVRIHLSTWLVYSWRVRCIASHGTSPCRLLTGVLNLPPKSRQLGGSISFQHILMAHVGSNQCWLKKRSTIESHPNQPTNQPTESWVFIIWLVPPQTFGDRILLMPPIGMEITHWKNPFETSVWGSMSLRSVVGSGQGNVQVLRKRGKAGHALKGRAPNHAPYMPPM